MRARWSRWWRWKARTGSSRSSRSSPPPFARACDTPYPRQVAGTSFGYARSVRGNSLHLVAIAGGLLAGLGVGLPLARGDAKGPTIGVDEIKEGMKGYGLTV